MSPDKLEAWLRRKRKGAVRLRLLATEIGSQPSAVADWDAEEICELSNPAETIFSECADYCDTKGESVQFQIQWLRADGTPAGSCFHRHAPLEDAEGNEGGKNARDADLGVNRIVAQFMRHDEVREKVLVGSLSTIFGTFESTIKVQAAIIEQQGRALTLLHQQVASMRAAAPDDPATEEARTEALARAGAWNKMAEVGPLVLQAWLEARSNGHTNGKAA